MEARRDHNRIHKPIFKKKMKKKEQNRKLYMLIKVTRIAEVTMNRKALKFRRLQLMKRWSELFRLVPKKSKSIVV